MKKFGNPQVVIDNLNSYCDDVALHPNDDENIKEAAKLIRDLYNDVLRLEYQRGHFEGDVKAVRKDLIEAVRFIDGLTHRIRLMGGSQDAPTTGYASVSNALHFIENLDTAAGWAEGGTE